MFVLEYGKKFEFYKSYIQRLQNIPNTLFIMNTNDKKHSHSIHYFMYKDIES